MTRPGWPQLRLRAFAAVTITSAAVISFDSIRHLATVYGFAELSWMFPLTLDAVAAFGMDLWIRESAAMRSARALALVAIGLSLVSNVADHWLSQRSVLAALLGAVPPAMLAALLAVLHRHQAGPHVAPDHGPLAGPAEFGPPTVSLVDDADRITVPASIVFRPFGPVPPPTLVPDRVLTPLSDQTDHVEPVRTPPVQRKRVAAVRTVRVAGSNRRSGTGDTDIKAWVRDQANLPTKQDIMDRFSVGSGRALKLRKEALDG